MACAIGFESLLDSSWQIEGGILHKGLFFLTAAPRRLYGLLFTLKCLQLTIRVGYSSCRYS
jgi:hypothetical protein